MNHEHHYEVVAKAIRYIASHYRSQPGLDEVAGHVHLSKHHFQRIFKQWAGISPKEFLQFTTIEHAKACLLQGRTTLEAALQSGLSGNGRLHDLFIKLEACSPGTFKNRLEGTDICYDIIQTPFGQAFVAETSYGISHMTFTASPDKMAQLLQNIHPQAKFRNGLGTHGKTLQEYFSEWHPPARPVTLALSGTPFQIKVWEALISIPPAHLVTYRDIASFIGHPKASRAVGAAVGANQVAYLIPCHRVIRQTGRFGEYRWGKDRKVIMHGYESAVNIMPAGSRKNFQS